MPDKPFKRSGPGERRPFVAGPPARGAARPEAGPRAPAGGAGPAGVGEEAFGRMVPVKHEGPLPWVQLRNAAYSPSIFRKMIGRTDPKVANGDLVRVYDRDGHVFGTGMFSGQSQIGLRMLTFGPAEVNESLVTERLAEAVRLRREGLELEKVSDAYRVVHAEGDGLPGLIVDRLGEYAVVELFSFGMYRRSGDISEELKMLLGVKHVLVRADERICEIEGFRLDEDSPAGPTRERSAAPDRKSTIITENGVRFQIDLTHGHKTGFFCDQRENRLMLTQFTAGKSVLDLCCYSGGFGVYAGALGKAASVVCVDLDEDAIALAQRNANLNKVPRSVLSTVHSDSFPYLRQMQENGKKFDVIVLDPPKLIPTQDDFAEGRAKYFDLNKLGMQSVAPGGMLVTCSCSGLLSIDEFFNVIRGAARSAGRRVQVLRLTGPGADHPVMTDHPESAYLKCLWCRVW